MTKFVVPSNVEHNVERIWCRKNCGFHVEYREEDSFQKKASAITKFRKHEEKCKCKNRKGTAEDKELAVD